MLDAGLDECFRLSPPECSMATGGYNHLQLNSKLPDYRQTAYSQLWGPSPALNK